MEETTKIVEEITIKRRMTRFVKDKLNKRIFYNCLLAIGMMLYMCIINSIYIYAKLEIVQIAEKIFPMILILLTVGIFELAYRRDNGKIAIVGIEFLVFSIIVLYIPKIYENLDQKFCIELTFIPIFCAIYYIAKSIMIYIKTDKEYKNNLSDVKEIVKEEG